MRKAYIFFILVVGILLAAGASWSIPMGTTEQVLSMNLNVTNLSGREVGFALTPDSHTELDFGTTFPGTMVIKTVNISRGSEPPALVTISMDGALASWLEVSDRDFLLKDLKEVKVSVRVPEDAREGRYSGHLTIAYKKTLFSVFLA